MPYEQPLYFMFNVGYYVFAAFLVYVWWHAADMNKRKTQFAKGSLFAAAAVTFFTPFVMWWCLIFISILKPD